MDTHLGTTERDLVMARIIPAPPAAVFAAWTEAEAVKAWWGPHGMTTTECEIELRPGGIHRTVMRDAAGKEYPNLAIIEAVEAPHRLVLRVADDACGPLLGTIATLTFAPVPEGTRLEARWWHPTPEMRAAHQAMGFEKGMGEMLDKLGAAVIPAHPGCPMATRPSREHGWLQRLLGEWTFETECSTGPGEPPMSATGVERVRPLGGFWVVGESEGGMPGGGPGRWIINLGFDPAAGRFRGSFVGSMMAHMFVYDGQLEEDGRTLTLDTEGPAMTGEGRARYRDVVRMETDDARVVTSAVQGADGGWTTFMTGRFRRVV